MRHILNSFAFVATSSAVGYFETPSDGYRPFGPGYTIGAYPQDFALVGPSLEAIHDSQKPSTGLAVDSVHNIYLTYPRNSGQTPSNVVICTSFHDEAPWPNASIQNCTASQDPSTCFINVQNVVRDDRGRLWVVDSGIPYNASPDADALFGGAKLMSFNETTAEHLRTYVIPGDLLSYRMNMNDMRVNTHSSPMPVETARCWQWISKTVVQCVGCSIRAWFEQTRSTSAHLAASSSIPGMVRRKVISPPRRMVSL
jgi:hypothetical protein